MKTTRLLKAELWILLGVVVLWAADWKTHCVPAAGALRQVVKVAPSERAYDLLGDVYYSYGQCDEGDRAYDKVEILACRKAVQAYPDEPNAHLDLGRAYYDANDFTHAIESYKQAIYLDPKFLKGYMDLGDVYASSEQYEASITAYNKAATLDPNDRWVHVCLAFTYYDMGQYENAIAEWKYLIECESEIAVLHAFVADCCVEAGRYGEAITACKKALQLKPDHPKSHYNLGRAYVEMGKKDLALQQYEMLKELDAESAKKLHALLVGEGR